MILSKFPNLDLKLMNTKFFIALKLLNEVIIQNKERILTKNYVNKLKCYAQNGGVVQNTTTALIHVIILCRSQIEH